MMSFQLKWLFLVLCLLGLSCKTDQGNKAETAEPFQKLSLTYAKGFSVKMYDNYKVLEIYSPWPRAEKIYKFALVDDKKIEKFLLDTSEFDAVISVPLKHIVATSTTHLPGLELLGETEKLVGFPGTNYVSSEKIRLRIDNNEIRELGKNESINTEVLLDLHPDVVIAFGIDGNNSTYQTIKNAGIPVIYNGDWVEETPLAKAEWIKLFGVLFNKSKQAEAVFSEIESEYLKAKNLATTVSNKPSILSGAMHKDIWYLPNGTSAEAQFINDANAYYFWKNTTGEGSLALNFETVFNRAKAADIWINPSYYESLDDLKKANMHYTKFDAYKNTSIYTMSNTKGPTGGVLYYELGLSRPDLVLKDLIKICHPELLPEYELFFFKKLQ